MIWLYVKFSRSLTKDCPKSAKCLLKVWQKSDKNLPKVWQNTLRMHTLRPFFHGLRDRRMRRAHAISAKSVSQFRFQNGGFGHTRVPESYCCSKIGQWATNFKTPQVKTPYGRALYDHFFMTWGISVSDEPKGSINLGFQIVVSVIY